MTLKVLILSLFLFLVLFGCLNVMDGFDDYTKYEKSPEYKLKMELKECPTQNCVCFVCKNNSGLTPPFDLFLSSSLKGGTCYFKESCDTEAVQELVESEKEGLMPFMLGVGPRFVDFADANVYCNNTMRMAVQWLTPRYLVGSGGEYVLPEPEVTECLLDKMVIPVYVLYSNGTSVSADRAMKVAEKLKDQGPVIITAEIDFDSNDPAIVEAVKNQIKKMRAVCPRVDDKNSPYCLLAVAPKMGDKEGLDKVMEDPTVKDAVDLIAFGVNSHYSKKCSSAYTFYEAMNFSKYAYFTYNKPVIWPYMLFDSGGKNKDESCTWSEFETSKAYYTFYNYIPVFISNGVIGAAAYEFYSADEITDPLKCNDCGLVKFEGNTAVPKDPAFSSWFYGCQAYGAQKNIMPAIFPKEDGGTCSYLTNIGLFVQDKITTGNPSSIYNVEDIESKRIFTCVPCIASCTDIADASCNPYNIASLDGASSKCEGFEELNYWASIRGLDPLYVRAIAWAESGLDTADPKKSICAVSYPVLFSNSGCNDGDYQVIPDPSGYCDEIINSIDPVTGLKKYDYTGHTAADHITVPWVKDLIAQGYSDAQLAQITDLKPCGLGLLQNIEYPYTVKEKFGDWGSENAIDPTMCAPDGEYNPYNASHSACLGTFRIKSFWDVAESQVNEHPDWFGIYDDDPAKTVKIKYVIGFMVYYRYAGAWKDEWVDKFVDQAGSSEDLCKKNVNPEYGEGTCCGNPNFIDYVTNCKDADGKKKNGMHVLKMYVALKDECGKKYGCPPAIIAANVESYVPKK